MIFNNINDYLFNLNTQNDELKKYYEDLINFEKMNYIPAVKLDTAIFLYSISNFKKPQNILEIGFGSGVSSAFIYKGNNNYKKFITLERDNFRYNRGLNLIKHFNIKNIDLRLLNAFDFLEKTDDKFDLIFLDAVKREYINYIEPVKKVINDGGLFVCDNIIFSERVIQENLDKKYIKGVESLKKFNQALSTDNFFNTFFISTGDGISISYKNPM